MIYLFISVFSFAAAAILYKYANHTNCDRISIVLSERITTVILLFIYITLFDRFALSPVITVLAIIGGTTIFFSRIALLASLKYGKVSSSWTIVNLSVVIPVLASIFLWHEIPLPRQIIGLFLVPVAIGLLQEEPGKY